MVRPSQVYRYGTPLGPVFTSLTRHSLYLLSVAVILWTVKRPLGVPYLYTSDGRTIRYPDPIVKVHDSIQLDIATGKVQDVIKFDTGNLCMVTGGRNTGRVGTIMSRERHAGSFDIVHVKDVNGHTFATRLGYIFIIGKGKKPYISLPKGKGIKLTIAEERDKRLGAK